MNNKEKIDIATLLKDCPHGMELDCATYDDMTLDNVVFESEYHYENTNNYPIKITTKSGFSTRLTKYGQNVDIEEAKCMIFPKGKTTWEGFVPPSRFKDGDILFVDTNDDGDEKDCFKYIFIFKEMDGCKVIAHCYMTMDGYSKPREVYLVDDTDTYPIRFATEEEKEKLFDAIKEDGLMWNDETKTLEELTAPRFEVGDRVQWRDPRIDSSIKVIKSLESDRYRLDDGGYIKFGVERYYKLLKFDINTLKTFDKVLVRLTNNCIWTPKFFFYYDTSSKVKYYPFVTTDNIGYPQCIPYEGNEHLSGQTDNCDRFYRVWEE